MKFLKIGLCLIVSCICNVALGDAVEQNYWSCSVDAPFSACPYVNVSLPAKPGIKYIALSINNNAGGSYGPQPIYIYCNDVLRKTLNSTGQSGECNENEEIRVWIDPLGARLGEVGSILSIPIQDYQGSSVAQSQWVPWVAGCAIGFGGAVVGAVSALVLYKYCHKSGTGHVEGAREVEKSYGTFEVVECGTGTKV